MNPGKFITLEGGEGAGKSTQARALADALGRRGISVVVTREPGGSEGAEAIRQLLLQGEAGRWSAHSEALLFAAARADHLEKTIRPALSVGHWVICDRFLDSTRAYQGAAGGIDDAAILALHAFGSRGQLPDRTFLLDVTAENGFVRTQARDGGESDRIAGRGAQFHAAVADAFRGFAAAEPDRFRVIDANQAPADVTQSIIDDLAEWL